MERESDIKRIKSVIETMNQRYQIKGGEVRFAGIEGGNTVKIAPSGFCWQ